MAVSLKHYLTVTDDLLDAAAGLPEGAAKSAAEGSRIDPQGAETVECDTDVVSTEKPENKGKTWFSRDEADGSRTRNIRIDSPVL